MENQTLETQNINPHVPSPDQGITSPPLPKKRFFSHKKLLFVAIIILVILFIPLGYRGGFCAPCLEGQSTKCPPCPHGLGLDFPLGVKLILLAQQSIFKPPLDRIKLSKAPTPPTPIPEDPTASWKTYTGDGFTFKYPDKSLYDITISSPSAEPFNFYAYTEKDITSNNSINISLSAERNNRQADEFANSASQFLTNTSQQEVVVNNIKVIKLTGIMNTSNTVSYIFNNGDILFNLGYGYRNGQETERKVASDITDQILSTFTFTSPVPNQVIDISSWKTYVNSSGMYQLSFPKDYTLNEGRSVGVDGVVIQQGKAYAEILSPVLPGTNGNMKISINSAVSAYKTPEEVAATAGCGDIANKPGTPYTIDNTPALIFENTNCGPQGITQIDAVKNGRSYGISIEGTVPYKKMKPIYEGILSTFKFTK